MRVKRRRKKDIERGKEGDNAKKQRERERGRERERERERHRSWN